MISSRLSAHRRAVVGLSPVGGVAHEVGQGQHQRDVVQDPVERQQERKPHRELSSGRAASKGQKLLDRSPQHGYISCVIGNWSCIRTSAYVCKCTETIHRRGATPP